MGSYPARLRGTCPRHGFHFFNHFVLFFSSISSSSVFRFRYLRRGRLFVIFLSSSFVFLLSLEFFRVVVEFGALLFGGAIKLRQPPARKSDKGRGARNKKKHRNTPARESGSDLTFSTAGGKMPGGCKNQGVKSQRHAGEPDLKRTILLFF